VLHLQPTKKNIQLESKVKQLKEQLANESIARDKILEKIDDKFRRTSRKLRRC
jgi:hypothetical protein